MSAPSFFKSRRWMYLPVEIPEREMEAKILLALEAAGRGYGVLIGSKAMLSMMERLPKGVLIYKDASKPMLPLFRELRRRGHCVAVHDEEGLIQISDEEYSKKRLEFETLREIDLFFCWGKHQASTVKRAAERMAASPSIVVTGHPRVDLLRPEMDRHSPMAHSNVDRPMILINTKLAECNHRNGPRGWIDILVAHGMIRTDEEMTFRERQIQYKARLFEAYVTMIKKLCQAFPHTDFVLRPHPTENLEKWVEVLGHFPNLIVTFSYPVTHWIRRARMVIHTGCTTAVEARLLGVLPVHFEPMESGQFDVPLPKTISRVATTVEEIEALISNVPREPRVGGAGMSRQLPEQLVEHIAQYTGDPSYRLIVNEIARLSMPHAEMKFGDIAYLKCRSFVGKAKRLFRKSRRTRLSSISLRSMREMTESLGRISHPAVKVNVMELYPGLFYLQGNQAISEAICQSS